MLKTRTYVIYAAGVAAALASALALADESTRGQSAAEAESAAPPPSAALPMPDAGAASGTPASSASTSTSSAPPSPEAAAPNLPLPPQGPCKDGFHSIDGECVARRRLLSAHNERCEPACPDRKECVGENTCERIPLPPLPNPYLHDGVYVRLGLGVGRAANDFEGWALPAFEAAIGGAPTPGFTLGVGIYGAGLPALSDTETSLVYGVGPFFDVYPRPNDGFHVEAALAYTTLHVVAIDRVDCTNVSACLPRVRADRNDNGLGLVAGLGYEAWVGEQASFGLLLRIQYFATSLGLHGPTGNGTTNSLVIPAALLAVTNQ